MTPAKGSLSMDSPLNELAISKLNRENMIEQAAWRIYKNKQLRREIEIKEAQLRHVPCLKTRRDHEVQG
jgi:hypothetical protein